MDLLDKLQPLTDRLASFRDGAVPFDTTIEAVHGPTEVVIAGRRTLMLGSNNYFGLSFHPEVLSAAHAALDREGAGTTGSRVANGTFVAHRRLEQAFARRYDKRNAVVFTTGYQANLALISGLCSAGDTIIVDVDSHASIFDGARLSGAEVFVFRHNSAADLQRKLARQASPRRCLVVVEGLYSIGGDVAPLGAISDACRRAGAYLMVDEAHSFGAYGAQGLGCAEAQGVLDDVDFIVGTFSKALAGIGGYAVSDHAALKMLHFAARPYVFTASGSPANVAGVEAALRILEREPGLRKRLWENVRQMRTGLGRLGFQIGEVESPIVPIEIGSPERTVAMWRALLDAGIYVNLVLPPACRVDRCLLRTSYSAAHTPADIDAALSIFERIGRELGVLRSVDERVPGPVTRIGGAV